MSTRDASRWGWVALALGLSIAAEVSAQERPSGKADPKKLARSPRQVAEQLAAVYGKKLDQAAYIPALPLVAKLCLSEATGDPKYAEEVGRIVAPFLRGEQSPVPRSGSEQVGHLIFAELASRSKGKDRERWTLLCRSAADQIFGKDGKPLPLMPHHLEMSNAVFMAEPTLAATGRLTGERRYFDAAATHFASMRKLCLRCDGLYRHSPLCEAAWGRGNAIRRLQEKYPIDGRTGKGTSPVPREELAATFHGSECPDGSNLWSIAGSRTTSGKPILLNNPHQPWAALYWEAHVTVPGKINFYGSAFVGRPVLTTGFNEHLGWTHTVNNVDLEDFFALTIDPGRPGHYLLDGKPMPLTKKEVAVEVKGVDGSITTRKRTYWDSHLGPVVHRTPEKAFALKSAIYDDFRAHEGSWYALSKANSWKAFHALLKRERLPMFNLGYADADGNTFYLWNGLLPKRVDDGTDYRLDVPGDTGKYVWSGLQGIDDLPQLFNPRGGYVQNCNDAPWWTSLRDPLDPGNYPSYVEPGVPLRLRSQTSLAMLEGQEKFSLEDVMRLKFNPRMLLADRVKPALVKAIKDARDPSADLRSGLKVLEAWDNRTAADSRGGVLFQRFWDTYSA